MFVRLVILLCFLFCKTVLAYGGMMHMGTLQSATDQEKVVQGTSVHQNDCIIGKVTQAQSGEPLVGVTVMLNDPAGKLLRYTITSGNGSFRMELESGMEIVPGCELVFSCMGYAQVREMVGNSSVKQWNITMEPADIQIKEVVVRAPKVQMKGDTISYNVQSFANAQDKTIGDVLKRIPGVEVSKEGQIKYNGEAINKFYIEGADLLEGRYGLATNAINQKDVAKVELLENHQPVKALKDAAYSDRAAINIKLKEGAKAKWLGQILAQGGVGANNVPIEHSDSKSVENENRTDVGDNLPEKDGRFLWNSRLFAMSIGAKVQSMTTFKTNNTGENLIGEGRSFTADALSAEVFPHYSLPRYINVSPAATPNLDEQRTSFNKSILFNSSNLWKLKGDYTMKGEVSYAYNRTKSANSSLTDYFFEDGKQTAYESAISDGREHGVLATINLSANTEHYFLKNTLKTNLNWSDMNTYLRWNYENSMNTANDNGRENDYKNDTSLKELWQLARIPSFTLSNDLQFVKKLNKATLTAVSVNTFMAEPSKLQVFPYFEKVHTSAFFTNEYISVVRSIGCWNFTSTAGVSALLRQMQREDDRLDNTFNSINAYAKLRAVYESGRVRITLDVPFNYDGYWYKEPFGSFADSGNFSDIKDVVRPGNSQKGFLFLSPGGAIRWLATSRLSVNLRGKIGKAPVSADSFFAGSILNNYRSVQNGALFFTHNNEYSVYLGVAYKNPLDLFYASVSVSGNFTQKGTIAQQTFSGDFIIHSQLLEKNNVGIWIVNGEISKGIDFIKGKVAVAANYSVYNMQSVVNDVLTPYVLRQADVKTTISSNFARWGSLDYNLYYGRRSSLIKEEYSESGNKNKAAGNKQPATNMIKQTLSMNFTPFGWLTIHLNGEHYYNQITVEQSQHLYWIDASLTVKILENLELSASVTNLLNRQTYSYTIYSGLSSVSRQYAIRPRNLLAGVYWAF